MADFPTINFTPFQWEVLDRDYINKWNAMQAALDALQANIADFGAAVEQEQATAIQSVETIRDTEVIPAKNAAAASAQSASQDAGATSADRQAVADDRAHVDQQKTAVDSAAQSASQAATATANDRQAVAADRMHVDQQKAAVDNAALAAAGSADDAQQAKTNAEALYGDLTAVDDAKTAAQQAATAAGSEKSQAVTARQGAEQARDEAQTAAQQAGNLIDDQMEAANKVWSSEKVASELSGKADSSHTHSASDITSGTLSGSRLPNASRTTTGGVRVRLNGTTAYITNNGSLA